MSEEKLSYERPVLTEVGSFEAITQGGTEGTVFDGNFTRGDPVPLDPNGNPLIFS